MVILGEHPRQTHKGVPCTNDGVAMFVANCRSIPVSNDKHPYMDTIRTQNDEIEVAGSDVKCCNN